MATDAIGQTIPSWVEDNSYELKLPPGDLSFEFFFDNSSDFFKASI